MTSDPHDKPAPQSGVNDLPARLRRRRRPIIIGVAGDSGSGKSTYTQGLEWLLGPELVSQVSLDGYHAEDRATRRASGRSPLDPDANHLERAGTDLERLSRGEATRIPIYDHEDGVFKDARVHQPTPIILVEGLHTLYPALRSMLDVAVYVDTATEVKREWKMRRDTRERGYKGAEAEADRATGPSVRAVDRRSGAARRGHPAHPPQRAGQTGHWPLVSGCTRQLLSPRVDRRPRWR